MVYQHLHRESLPQSRRIEESCHPVFHALLLGLLAIPSLCLNFNSGGFTNSEFKLIWLSENIYPKYLIPAPGRIHEKAL